MAITQIELHTHIIPVNNQKDSPIDLQSSNNFFNIRVGYKVLPSDEVAPQVRRKIEPVYNQSQKNICRKMP